MEPCKYTQFFFYRRTADNGPNRVGGVRKRLRGLRRRLNLEYKWRKMRIWLINHYAVPIKYYPLARTTNFAKYLIRAGHEVKIFCASSVHNSDINLIEDDSLYKEESVDGIPYVYVRCRSYKTKIQRVFNMLDFAWNLKMVCARYEKPDVIMASSQTPFACMRALKMAKTLKAKSIMEVTDLWPESIASVGVASKSNPLFIPMYWFEKKMYEQADEIVFSMEGAYDYIAEKKWEKVIPKRKVHYINNGVDLEAFDYNKGQYIIQDEDLHNTDTFKAVYTGSIRLANDLGRLLDVAKCIKNDKVRILIWGKGDELARLKQRVEDEKITNVVFKGYVDKKYIPYITSQADLNIAHYLYSSASVLRYGISFNKLFDYMAAGKPILTDFPCKYNPSVQCGAGIDVEDARAETVAKAIDDIAEMGKELYDSYAQNARKGAEEYDFPKLTERIMKIIVK